MGRKALEVERYIDKLEQAVGLGATYELAAMFAGISSKTFERWRQAMPTAKAGSPLARLRERLALAEGRAAIRWLAKIEKAAQEGDWRAAAYKLERRWPEIYGRTLTNVAPTSPDGEALQGGGLSVLLQQAIIALPSKSPSPEQWAEDVAALRERAHGAVNGAQGAS